MHVNILKLYGYDRAIITRLTWAEHDLLTEYRNYQIPEHEFQSITKLKKERKEKRYSEILIRDTLLI